MPTLAEMVVKIGADLTGFKAGVGEVGKSLTQMGEKTKQIGKGFTTYLTAPIAGLGVASVLAFDKQAKAVAQVEAGLKATKGAAGLMKEELLDAAAKIQETSLFGDEDILQGVTAQLLTFTNIAEDQFLRAQQAAVDFATRLDGDLKGAAIGLGKALNDPIKGITALGKSGVSFSEDQKKVIKSLVESNRLADAQNLILSELENQYGGSAEAAAKAGTGPMKVFANSLGDLTEEFGAIIVEGLEPFVKYAGKIVKWLQGLSPNTKKWMVAVAGLAAALGPMLLAIGTFMKMLPVIKVGIIAVQGAMGPWVLAIAAVGAAVVLLIKHWDTVVEWMQNTFPRATEGFKNLWNQIKATVAFVMDAVRDRVTAVLDGLKTFWDTWGGEIMAVVSFAWNTILNVFDTAFGVLTNGLGAFLALIRGDWEGAWESMKGVITSVWDGIKVHVANAINALLELIPDFVKEWAGIEDIAIDVGEATTTAMKDTKEAVEGAEKAVTPALEKMADKLSPTKAGGLGKEAKDAKIEIDKVAVGMGEGGNFVTALGKAEAAAATAGAAIRDELQGSIATLTTDLPGHTSTIDAELKKIATPEGGGFFGDVADGMNKALGGASNWIKDTWIPDLAGSFGGTDGLVGAITGVLNGDFAGLFTAMGPWGAALSIGLQVLTDWAPKIYDFFKGLANEIASFFSTVGGWLSDMFGSNHTDQGTEGGGITGWTGGSLGELDDMFNWNGLNGLGGRITIMLDGRTLAEGVLPHLGGALELRGVTV